MARNARWGQILTVSSRLLVSLVEVVICRPSVKRWQDWGEFSHTCEDQTWISGSRDPSCSVLLLDHDQYEQLSRRMHALDESRHHFSWLGGNSFLAAFEQLWACEATLVVFCAHLEPGSLEFEIQPFQTSKQLIRRQCPRTAAKGQQLSTFSIPRCWM